MERDRGNQPAGKEKSQDDKELETLKAMFGDAIPDELIELVKMMKESGGVGMMDLPTASRLFGGVFDSMADKAKSRLLFDFLLQQSSQDKLRPEDIMRRKEKFEYLVGLRGELLAFVKHLQSSEFRKQVLVAVTSLDKLRDKDLLRKRMNVIMGQNGFSKLPDALARMIEADINRIGTLIEIGDRFEEETNRIMPQVVEDSDEVRTKAVMIEDLLLKFEANVMSFYDLLKNILETIERAPQRYWEITKGIEHECQEIESNYGDADSPDKGSFGALFGSPEKSRDVPFFNNHGFLTAFLDECVDKIPAIDYIEGGDDFDEHGDDAQDKEKQTKYDKRKMALYAE